MTSGSGKESSKIVFLISDSNNALRTTNTTYQEEYMYIDTLLTHKIVSIYLSRNMFSKYTNVSRKVLNELLDKTDVCLNRSES